MSGHKLVNGNVDIESYERYWMGVSNRSGTVRGCLQELTLRCDIALEALRTRGWLPTDIYIASVAMGSGLTSLWNISHMPVPMQSRLEELKEGAHADVALLDRVRVYLMCAEGSDLEKWFRAHSNMEYECAPSLTWASYRGVEDMGVRARLHSQGAGWWQVAKWGGVEGVAG